MIPTDPTLFIISFLRARNATFSSYRITDIGSRNLEKTYPNGWQPGNGQEAFARWRGEVQKTGNRG